MMETNLITEDPNVPVFRSNIEAPAKVDQVQKSLLDSDRIYQVDVDLDDVDNVLRVECHPDYFPTQIQEQLSQLGFTCASLL